jgi:hypothetical protein
LIHVSIFRNAIDKRPAAQDDFASWDEIADEIEALAAESVCPDEPLPYRGKDLPPKARLVNFHFGRLTTPRNANENVEAHTALAIDVDRCRLVDVIERLDASSWAAIVYGSPSDDTSKPDARRVRVCAPITRELAPGEIKAARRAFAEAIGIGPGQGVEGADASSQVFFIGRVEGTAPREVWRFEGAPVDVDALPPPRLAWKAERPDVEGTAERIDASPDERTAALLEALAEHWEAPGMADNRRATLRALGGYLARRGWSDEQIAAVAEGLDTARPEDVRAGLMLDAARQARRDPEGTAGWSGLAAWSPKAAQAIERTAKDPREPAGWPGVWSDWWGRYLARREARPPAALDPEDDAHAEPPGQLPVFVVTQEGKESWHYDPRTDAYVPFGVRSLHASLAASGASAYVETHDGKRRKGAQALLDDGPTAIVESVAVDFTRAGRAEYDAAGARMLLGVRTLDVAPRRDEAVDAWLRELAGAKYDTVATFVASCAQAFSHRWAIALAILGPNSIGKTLLAKALASMWCATHPVPLRAVIAQFNASMSRCPIVLDDECDALKSKDGVSTEKLRQLVQDDARDIEPKGLEKRTLLGCQRFIFTGNDATDISFNDVKPGALGAMAQRFAIVTVPESRRDSIMAALRRFAVDEDSAHVDMARLRGHLAWIQEEWRDRIGSERFIGQSDENAAEATATMAQARIETNPRVFERIAEVLRGEVTDAPDVFWHSGGLFARVDHLADKVGDFAPDVRAAIAGVVSAARRVIKVDGKTITCTQLNAETLRAALGIDDAPVEAPTPRARFAGVRAK